MTGIDAGFNNRTGFAPLRYLTPTAIRQHDGEISMVPLSVSPFLTSMELRLMPGVSAWLLAVLAEEFDRRTLSLCDQPGADRASKPRSRLNALFESVNGASMLQKPQ